MYVHDILRELKNVKKHGDYWTAKCPSHHDEENSLQVSQRQDGSIGISCHANCNTESVMDALGLSMKDLFPPKEQLQKNGKEIDREYLYKDIEGNIVHKTIRFKGKSFTQCRPDGKGGWVYSLKDIKTIIYNLQAVTTAISKGETIYIVEGEKDVENLNSIGITSTTSPMGAGKWRKHYSEYLKGANVIILPDNDNAGREHAKKVYAELEGYAVSKKIVELPNLPEKGDVSDWLAMGGTKEKLLEIVENASCNTLEEYTQNTLNNTEKLPKWIKEKKVIPQVLASHIRENTYYIFVRNTATDGVIRYWYIDGHYKQISDEELKGYIKGFIPTELQKTRDINEVFNLLITDLNFIPIDELNIDENIINFRNGILYLDTGELKAHTPEIYSTIQIPCNYNPDAVASDEQYFDKFIEHLTTGDEEVKSLLLQFIGVAISNIKGWRMKKALFMVGDGDVGKSQLKELTHKLIGANNCSGIDLTTLEQRFGTSTIFNKRLIGSSDMSYATVNELKAFKSITGGDTLSAEYKGKNSFNFVFNGLVWFCCNKLPKFGGDKGEHVYNRIMVCECNNPVPKKDKYLQDKMYSEREYIVSLAIKELQKVIQNDYEFIIPKVMQRAVDKYKVTNNSFLLFLEECTTERKFEKVQDNCTKAKLFEVYKAWCNDNNRGYYESKKDVKETLEGLGLADEKKVQGIWYYSKFTLTVDAKKEYSGIYGYDSFDIKER